jgi:hypothetical protein
MAVVGAPTTTGIGLKIGSFILKKNSFLQGLLFLLKKQVAITYATLRTGYKTN